MGRKSKKRREMCICSLVAQTVKNLPAIQETWVRILGQENPLEKGMATHSCILAWRIPWTEAPGGLRSTGLGKVGHAVGLTEGRIDGRKSGWATGRRHLAASKPGPGNWKADSFVQLLPLRLAVSSLGQTTYGFRTLVFSSLKRVLYRLLGRNVMRSECSNEILSPAQSSVSFGCSFPISPFFPFIVSFHSSFVL